MHSNTLSTGSNGLQVLCKQAGWLSMCLCRRMHCDMSPWLHWTATGHLIKEPHQGTINWNQSWMQILHDNTCNPEVSLHLILHVIDTSRLCSWTKCLTSSSYQTISRFLRLPVLSVLLADTTSGNGYYWKLFKYLSLFGQHRKYFGTSNMLAVKW